MPRIGPLEIIIILVIILIIFGVGRLPEVGPSEKNRFSVVSFSCHRASSALAIAFTPSR